MLASQQKMLDRRGEENDAEDEQMREVYENHLWRVRYMLKNDPAFEWLEVSYSDMLADPEAEAKRLAAFLGCSDKAQVMAEVVDPELYRNRAAS